MDFVQARLYFTNKDLLGHLKRSLPRISRQQVANVLQQEWKLDPAANSLNYMTFMSNNLGELATAHHTGRYYTFERDPRWLRCLITFRGLFKGYLKVL